MKKKITITIYIFFHFREDGIIVENFTLKPIDLSDSIGLRLKASFTQVNPSTPVGK